ncbi:MND1-interacting protein 1-like [Cocos nucifera]|uniref:MND1-interacting protein 1-like n=1 Tax=Cocos nucifera TaxID=13894 RepID=A0A8K0N792_COCNU|nr:MND1-interacting protein 1-like [Cocos nucifera]
MDALSHNIFQNTLACLSSLATARDYDTGSYIPMRRFTKLRHLQEYSLARMVCLLQQIRPHLSRGDAMWCLLISDGRASTIDMPPLSYSTTPYPNPTLTPVPDSTVNCALLMAPTLLRRRTTSVNFMLRRVAVEVLIFCRP